MKGGVKIGKEGGRKGREERGRGAQSQSSEHVEAFWGNAYLTSSPASAQCRAKAVSSGNVC